MTDATLTLRPAADDGLAYVEALLERNDLPSADVRAKPDCFYIGYDGDDRVGVGGVEEYGPVGLLRSVVVEEPARGAGLGSALCERLEMRARTSGVETLYLLTTTTGGFFANRGYVRVERSDIPDAVRRTAEFEELCPATAACLRKSL